MDPHNSICVMHLFPAIVVGIAMWAGILKYAARELIDIAISEASYESVSYKVVKKYMEEINKPWEPRIHSLFDLSDVESDLLEEEKIKQEMDEDLSEFFEEEYEEWIRAHEEEYSAKTC